MALTNRCIRCGQWCLAGDFHDCASLKKEVEDKMSKTSTPLVDSLNLPLVHTEAFALAPGGLYVNIKDLEAALEKLPKVIRCNDWSEDEWSAKVRGKCEAL